MRSGGFTFDIRRPSPPEPHLSVDQVLYTKITWNFLLLLSICDSFIINLHGNLIHVLLDLIALEFHQVTRNSLRSHRLYYINILDHAVKICSEYQVGFRCDYFMWSIFSGWFGNWKWQVVGILIIFCWLNILNSQTFMEW